MDAITAQPASQPLIVSCCQFCPHVVQASSPGEATFFLGVHDMLEHGIPQLAVAR